MSFVRPTLALADLSARRANQAMYLFLGITTVLGGGTISCGSSTLPPVTAVDIGSISINGGGAQLDRGYHVTLTATVRDKLGTTITPTPALAWRSSNENVATIDLNGRLAALDTGNTSVFASANGVTSAAVPVRVTWLGPAKIATFQFTPPNAATPGATADTIRVQVLDVNGRPPAVVARIAFAVTAGGGSVTPAIATTNNTGVAFAVWTLGPAAGTNTVTATALGEDDKPFSFVTPNVTTFTMKTFAALTPVAGDAQTGLILSALPVSPSVLVVDSAGKPRPGVPVTFTATGGGRVATPVVSTGANGIASPGVWTLGDIPGDQTLIAKVDIASLTLRATATGTPVYYMPKQVIAGGYATCAINTDDTASCWGEQPKVGDSTTVNRPTPTPTKNGIRFKSVVGSMVNPSHYCGISVSQEIYCWGFSALTDTSGRVTNTVVPTRLQSATVWSTVAPGFAHNCAVATDQTAYCWGLNAAGQLGDGSTTTHYVPAPVAGGFKFTTVSSGNGHSCGLSIDGSAFCWGLNQNGQLGDGTTTQRQAPTAVGGAFTFQSISAGETFTCGLTSLGRAYCWGNLGSGSNVVSTPRTYTAAPIFTSLSVGGGHACALTADGTAYCWGDNTGGQLGDSTVAFRANPTAVVTPLKFKSVRAGYVHTCATTTTDGAVTCWGLNKAFELGDSTSANRLTPHRLVLNVKP
jgi:alpha-tubulin suppressor-like RCC1 family protein